MPTYEYECESCNHRMEQRQSMKDKPLRKCPSCRKNKLTRIISGGMGFYDMTPKTLGGIADRNARDLRKAGMMPPSKAKRKPAPWWRKDKDKIDYDVLRNPRRYVATGEK